MKLLHGIIVCGFFTGLLRGMGGSDEDMSSSSGSSDDNTDIIVHPEREARGQYASATDFPTLNFNFLQEGDRTPQRESSDEDIEIKGSNQQQAVGKKIQTGGIGSKNQKNQQVFVDTKKPFLIKTVSWDNFQRIKEIDKRNAAKEGRQTHSDEDKKAMEQGSAQYIEVMGSPKSKLLGKNKNAEKSFKNRIEISKQDGQWRLSIHKNAQIVRVVKESQYPTWVLSNVQPKNTGSFSKSNAGSMAYDGDDAAYCRKMHNAMFRAYLSTPKKFSDMIDQEKCGLLEGGSREDRFIYDDTEFRQETFSHVVNGQEKQIDNFDGWQLNTKEVEDIVLAKFSTPYKLKKSAEKLKKSMKFWYKEHGDSFFSAAVGLTAANMALHCWHWWKK